MSELTADTITDDQIRALRAEHPRTKALCAIALAFYETNGDPDRMSAREKCAAILNARCPKCKALCDHSTWDGANCPWCRQP